MLDDIALFISIIETGSLRAAAEKAKIPAPTLTRHLQSLEKQLGCRLLHRSARRLTPTNEGWQYYEQCRPLIHALLQTTRSLDITLNQPSGLVRVLAPIDLSNLVLATAWLDFMTQYPDIQLELELSNQTQDLVGSNADLAIRVGELPDSLLNSRKLGQARTSLLVASPAYLKQKGIPQNFDALEAHDLLIGQPQSIWDGIKNVKTQEVKRWQPQGRLMVNSFSFALEAACSGAGILLCPVSLCHRYLESGVLVNVLPDWQTGPREIHAVWSQQRYVPARVRVLIEHLVKFCAGQPLLQS